MEALRTLLAGKRARAAREANAPRKPREGTKQEQVLAMLRRPEGATVAQIAEATGWAQHTVRGFFAGLRKREGIAVEVLERVRQVGPNKAGARGSFTVYRVAG
jgi:predicted ArsR family transcriptional regulator